MLQKTLSNGIGIELDEIVRNLIENFCLFGTLILNIIYEQNTEEQGADAYNKEPTLTYIRHLMKVENREKLSGEKVNREPLFHV